jgi:hypothetical protein
MEVYQTEEACISFEDFSKRIRFRNGAYTGTHTNKKKVEIADQRKEKKIKFIMQFNTV